MSVLAIVTNFTLLRCGGCDIPFYVPNTWYARKSGNNESFTCPNGCGRRFVGETDAEKHRKRAECLAQQLASREEDLRVASASLTATKGQLTKARKREVNGVCPCCNRTFADVQRHMANKHPGEAPALGHLAHKPARGVS